MKPQIVQVITELEPAGAERVLADLCIDLKKRGFGVSVISLQKPPSVKTIIDDLLSNGIEVFCLNITKKTPWRLLKLKNLISEIRIKSPSSKIIIHSHLMHANLACRFAKLIGKNFYLLNTIHTAEKRDKQKILFLLDKLTLKLCDIYTAVSVAARNWHANKLRIPSASIYVVHNGIKEPKSLTMVQRNELIAQWGFQNCKKVIGSVGRLDIEKGYDLFLNFLPELSNAIPPGETWGIVLLGEGLQRNKLEAIAKNTPPNIIVSLPGYRKDAADCIIAFDLFVMPSRYEGFGLALVEAMACGIPILASKADSLEELMKVYFNGKCLDFAESKKAVRSIIEYIQMPKIKSDVSDFTVKKMADNYIRLYESL